LFSDLPVAVAVAVLVFLKLPTTIIQVNLIHLSTKITTQHKLYNDWITLFCVNIWNQKQGKKICGRNGFQQTGAFPFVLICFPVDFQSLCFYLVA